MIKLREWNSAEYLKTEDDIERYLEICRNEAGDDLGFMTRAFEIVAIARRSGFLAVPAV